MKKKPDYSKEKSLTAVSFDTIGGGKLKNLVDQYITNAVSEALMQKKFNDVEKNIIKVNIEISVEPIDDMNFEVKGKVKKTLPQSSCTAIAVGDEFGLYVRKDGAEGSPLQGSLEDDDDEIEISGPGQKVKTSMKKMNQVAKDLKKEVVEDVEEDESQESEDINDIISMKKKV